MPKKLFEKGKSGNPKGRKKGIRDRRWDYHDLVAALKRKNHDPFDIQIKLSQSSDERIAKDANKVLMDKLIASRKHIENETDDSVKELLGALKQQLDEATNKHRKDH